MWTPVDRCVAEWGFVGYSGAAFQDRGGGAPPTPPPRSEGFFARMKRDHGQRGVPRALRIFARREEQAQRAGQAACPVLRRTGSGPGPGAPRADLGAAE